MLLFIYLWKNLGCLGIKGNELLMKMADCLKTNLEGRNITKIELD